MIIKKAIAAIALMAGSIATVASAMAFFGSFWWVFDLLANYRWQLMWAALVASVIYALSGKGLFTAVFIVTAAVNMWLILPAWVGSQPAATGEDTVRVMHIDLSGELEDLDASIAQLLETDSDLLLVGGIATDRIAPLVTQDSPYTLLTDPGPPSGVTVFGTSTWRVDSSASSDGQIVHLISVPSGTGVIDVVTTWGEMGTSAASDEALWQRYIHLTDVVGDARNPVAVIGSLGATRWAAPTRYLHSRSTLRDATEGAGYLSTAPISDLPIVGRWVGIPIDVAYMSPELTPLDVIVGPDIGANHLPLTIDISPVVP
jgi:hypothetical protein